MKSSIHPRSATCSAYDAGNGEGAQQRNGGAVKKRPAALQVICLGDSGGPSEENVTAFLVRSCASEWAKGSLLAVDAGSHLAPITRIMERDFPVARRKAEGEEGRAAGGHGRALGDRGRSVREEEEKEEEEERSRAGNGMKTPGLSKDLASTSLSPAPEYDMDDEEEEERKPEPTVMTEGPFAGLKMPHASARANALHVLQVYISTYLITHPHIDHIAGFTINTAAFHATSKPKTLAALPGTVDAIKRHVFNDVIWPNLSDEDGGVGFVTFQRLKEGGDPMLGEGEGRGYIDVCEGLGAKAFKVSHGVCTKSPPSHQHRGSITGLSDSAATETTTGMARSMSLTQHSQYSAPGTPAPTPRQSFYQSLPSPRMTPQDASCVVDSTAYFLRDSETGRELLFFGDVEPDSISLSPRNHIIWAEAARKFASGCLTGLFIECSYDDSQADSYLFGHLAPRHLIAEMQTLAAMTREAKTHRAADQQLHSAKKRKRSGPNGFTDAPRFAAADAGRKRSRSLASRFQSQNARRPSEPDHTLPDAEPGHAATGPPSPTSHASYLPSSAADGSLPDAPMSPLSTANPQPPQSQPQQQQQQLANPNSQPHSSRPHFSPTALSRANTAEQVSQAWEKPLQGLKVVVIHVKDTFKDGPHVRESILAQLQAHERVLADEGRGLGCEFIVSRSGESYWF